MFDMRKLKIIDMRKLRKLKITEILLIINVAIYIVSAILSFNAFAISNTVLIRIAQSNYMIIYNFLYYEFLTAIFVHLNLAHILSNSLFLLIFGYRCEELFSTRDFLIIYLISGLIGNFLSLLLGINSISGGSSGAILGIFAANLYAISQEEKKAFKTYLLIGVIFLLFIGAQYGVNPISHWSGFLVGIVLGRYLSIKSKSKREKKSISKDRKKKILIRR
jgi:rhomboid protease GluP